MHPSIHAVEMPHKPALICGGSGEVITFAELDRRSNQGAHLFRELDLGVGDVIAIMIENNPRYHEIAWAAQRAGLMFVCVPTHLKPGEAEYILRDSGAKLLVTSAAVGDTPRVLPTRLPQLQFFMIGRAGTQYRSFEAERAAQPTTPVADECAGVDMLYSSGTTGLPKGIRSELPGNRDIAGETVMDRVVRDLFGLIPDDIYLCPAPLYHAAPLRWTMAIQKMGATVVLMEKFDAQEALRLIERHRITVGQFVPTHFVRMLKLPAYVRSRYDHRSLRLAIHAAAPCPVSVKEEMIEWWGPIIEEYYAGSEGIGMTRIGAVEWLEHRGSVGRAVIGEIKICDENGDILPCREKGGIYFAGGNPFEYHNDLAKTTASKNKHGWATLGDVGWLDEEGYLYLSDRKSFMIISGGVNIYPQEIEDILVTHPKVADVAVIGVPHSEMGEQVIAIVQPADMTDAGSALADELTEWLRPQVSGVKLPRRIDFLAEFPRLPTGKLSKRLLRDQWAISAANLERIEPCGHGEYS